MRCVPVAVAIVVLSSCTSTINASADYPSRPDRLHESGIHGEIDADAGALQCGPADISIELVPMKNILPSQQRVGIEFDLGPYDRPCIISGHPNVEFIGGFAGPLGGESCPIVLKHEAATPVRVDADTSAHAVITFLSASAARPPDYVRVQLPGVLEGDSFTWEYGPVVCHSGATRPGTYVGVIQPGAVPAN